VPFTADDEDGIDAAGHPERRPDVRN
jgi:hypothetical protein